LEAFTIETNYYRKQYHISNNYFATLAGVCKQNKILRSKRGDRGRTRENAINVIEFKACQ
jgi:hypothetical protein